MITQDQLAVGDLTVEAATAIDNPGWRAYFPESVRVNNRWVCDVTVYNGAVKFVVPVAYDRSLGECLPQLQAEIAKRDEVTLKPLPMIEPGTDIDIEEVALAAKEVAVTAEPMTKEQQIAADWWERFNAARTAAVLATVPDDVRADYRPEYGGLR